MNQPANGNGASTQPGAQEVQVQARPEYRDDFWGRLFPGQIPPIEFPEALDGDHFDLEGHEVRVIEAGPTDTVNKLRTAPLWGLHIKSRFMHDLNSLTLDDAIRRHKGEAAHVVDKYKALSATQQGQLLTFLRSL